MLAVVAALWFLAAQILAVAHAASPEGLAKGHDKAACGWCVTHDRTGGGLTPSEPALAPPAGADAPETSTAPALNAPPRRLAAAPRGPPTEAF